MNRRARLTLVVVILQYLAVLIGSIAGLSRVWRLYVYWLPSAPLLEPRTSCAIAVLALVVEFLRQSVSPELRQTRPGCAWLCLGCVVYALALMYLDPFAEFRGNSWYVINVCLLVPFLLAIGPLVRSGTWLGVIGVVLLYAACLAMITWNGTSWQGYASGFLHREVP